MIILEAELLSDNLDSTEDFYTNTLGLELLGKDADLVSFRAGHSVLLFRRSLNLQPVYHFAFNIPRNTIDEALFWILSKTPVIPVPGGEQIADFSAWNAKAFYFYDNNGNILEMIARFDLENETKEPFTASVISGLSEMAVVTEDVAAYTAELSRLTAVPPYEKQPVLPNFAALGDANGLFIVSEKGRNWFPTDKPANPFFTRIRIRSGDVIRELKLNESGNQPAA